ncbi:hypothetical protein PG988_016144 [Apiospora saccharicola]
MTDSIIATKPTEAEIRPGTFTLGIPHRLLNNPMPLRSRSNRRHQQVHLGHIASPTSPSPSPSQESNAASRLWRLAASRVCDTMRSPAGKEATDQMDAESDARPALALASRRIDRIRGWSGELHSMIRPPVVVVVVNGSRGRAARGTGTTLG